MMISTTNSTYQLGNTLNSASGAQMVFPNTSAPSAFRQQNKLKIAIRPQNEYQVFQNADPLLQLKEGSMNQQPPPKKQQSLLFSNSLIKTSSQGTLNKSNLNSGLSMMPTEMSETMSSHAPMMPFQKKNSCIGLTLPSKTFYGNEKIMSPQQPLTAKAAEQKSNNFYFASKNNKINKRTIFKFNEKIWDSTKKPSQSGVVVITSENSPKIKQAQKQQQQQQNAPTSLVGTSRTSLEGGNEKQAKTLTNFNKLTAYIQTEHRSRAEEKPGSNNISKISPSGHQQNPQYPTTNQSSQSTLLIEYRKMQLTNYKQQLKLQQLEKLCQEQEERLREKDQIIIAYENKSLSSSTTHITSANTTTTKTVNPKQIIKAPSLLTTNHTNQNIHIEGNSSNNNSFNNNNTHDKKNFSNSAAQISLSIIKSPHSPQRSILHTSAISIPKGIQNYPQSTHELISPKPSKHKTKLLSINLQNSEVKDLIKNSHFNQHISSGGQPHFSELYSEQIETNDYDHSSMLNLISPNKDSQQTFAFQSNEQNESSQGIHHQPQSPNLSKGLSELLERMKKVLLAKKKKE